MNRQNILHNTKKSFYLVDRSEIYDLTLSSDETDFKSEVIFSTDFIGLVDGKKLPINIDFNLSGSVRNINIPYSSNTKDNILISTNYYNSDLLCPSGFTELCDIGLVGTDNGLVSDMSGYTLFFTNEIMDDSNKWDLLKYDRRLKLHQVTSITNNNVFLFSGNTLKTTYNVESKQHSKYGYYQELYGGFFQGFYKLFGYDYEIFPERTNKGWSAELLIKPRLNNDITPPSGYTTLNEIYPENKNILFYIGSRAENKYYHSFSGTPSGVTNYTRITEDLDCIETCGCSNTAITTSDCFKVYPPSDIISERTPCCDCENVDTEIKDTDPKFDSMSNGFAIKLCGDVSNPKIGFKSLLFNDYCVTTGDCENSGLTYNTGYTIDERCSDIGIYDFCVSASTAFTANEHWVQISVVWERNKYFENCDLYNFGGLGSIIKKDYEDTLSNQSVNLIKPPVTNNEITPKEITQITLNEKWLKEIDYRMGKLKIYANGRLFWTFDDVEEIIPRPLNTQKEKQIGVPYNISLGGGTQGLHDHLIFSGCPDDINNIKYTQDPELFPDNILQNTTFSGLNTNILIEKTFAGTFEGAISQFRLYSEPLTSDEIKHNFKLNKDKFDLFDPDCPDCQICFINDIEYDIFN